MEVGSISELEERLKGEEGAGLRELFVSRLTHLESMLGGKIEAGLRPGDFSRATDLRDAVQLAGKLLSGLR